jgi:hypothetical protein
MNHFYRNTDKFPENWFTFPKLYSYFVDIIKDNGTIVEIGSYKGQSTVYMAVEIANSNKNICFYAIDNWEGSDEITNKLSPYYNKNIDLLFDTYLCNIEPVKQYIKNIRADSVESAKFFENKSVDIVFIDACHEYSCLKQDIEVWMPKIKNGGILAGHDYNNGWSGVNLAVDEIFGKKNIQTQEYCWIYNIV